MTTSFPTDLDTLTNPATTDKQNNPSHAAQHANANDAIEALEAKVGEDSSVVTTSHDYKISTNKTTMDNHIASASNPHSVTKTQVSLGSADNTSDATKLAATLLAVYPVGSIYISIVSTNPGTLFGGTWVAFGAGKTLVGLNAAETEFDVVEETGGSKTNSHTHTTTDHSHTTSDHSHGFSTGVSNSNVNVPSGSFYGVATNAHGHSGTTGGASDGNTTSGASTGNTTSAPSDTNNLQPYIVTYFFKRTV